jgi:hypothetical protein
MLFLSFWKAQYGWLSVPIRDEIVRAGPCRAGKNPAQKIVCRAVPKNYGTCRAVPAKIRHDLISGPNSLPI